MKFLVTILLLSIQALPSHAKTPRWLSQLIEPAIDYFEDSEEEKSPFQDQNQPHRFEGISPDYYSINQETSPSEIVTLGSYRDFFRSQNYILSTMILGSDSDEKDALKTLFSQNISSVEFSEIMKELSMKAPQKRALYGDLTNPCRINREAMLEEQQANFWAAPLQNAVDKSALQANQSRLLFPGYGFTECFLDLSIAKAPARADSTSRS